MNRIRENRRLKKENKILWIVLGVLALTTSFFACKYFDEREYRIHTVYEYEHNCTYEWNMYGDYTVCR